MSVVFHSRDVSSAQAYVRERSGGAVQDKQCVVSSSDGRAAAAAAAIGKIHTEGSVVVMGLEKKADDDEGSSESSSIGLPDEEEEEEDDEGEDVVLDSKPNDSPVASLASLEESLPVKRGLSNCFSGKSKSFANLLDVSAVKDIEKREKPLNKRRRMMIAYKLSKKYTFYSSSRNHCSKPLLALNEEEREVNEEEVKVEEEYTSEEEEEDAV